MEDPNNFNIKSFRILRDFVIEIQFEDGKLQKINFGKVENKGWWKELDNIDYFNQVKINIMHNLEWPNGQDFKPEHLYYWEKYSKYYQS